MAWPSASATSPTTSPAHSSKPADSDHTYTPNCEEPFIGTVAAYGKGDNEADFWFHWQDGGLIDRITNEVRVTPLTTNTPLPPTYESIQLASGQALECRTYYDTKVREYNQAAIQKVAFYADGSKNSGKSDRYGDQSVALGQTVRSSVIGDFRPAGAGDGIY